MKRLCIVSTFEEAQRIQSLLEGKGIPIDWRGGSTVRNDRQPYSAPLYVCLDSQFEDAQTILRDPSHEPAQPVDVEQYRRAIESDGMKSVFDYLFIPSLIIIAVCVVLIAVIYFINTSGRRTPPDSTMRSVGFANGVKSEPSQTIYIP